MLWHNALGMGRDDRDGSDPDAARSADPFARLAEALPNQAPPSQRRLPLSRRSRPSLSELAPVIPPARASAPARTLTAPPARHADDPLLPSVIVEDDPTVPGRPPIPRFTGGEATTRMHLPRPGARGPSPSLVLTILAISITVFGLGLFVLLARSW
jgi:hypothetical protein